MNKLLKTFALFYVITFLLLLRKFGNVIHHFCKNKLLNFKYLSSSIKKDKKRFNLSIDNIIDTKKILGSF